jgi:hypothetical protein
VAELSETEGIQLVHDVLDAGLTDRNGKKIGRVDALALTLEDDGRARVTAILIGGPVRAKRMGRLMTWIHHVMCVVFRLDPTRGVSLVPFAAVRCIGDTIDVDVDGGTLASGHLERWLGRNLIGRIPGSHGDKK